MAMAKSASGRALQPPTDMYESDSDSGVESESGVEEDDDSEGVEMGDMAASLKAGNLRKSGALGKPGALLDPGLSGSGSGVGLNGPSGVRLASGSSGKLLNKQHDDGKAGAAAAAGASGSDAGVSSGATDSKQVEAAAAAAAAAAVRTKSTGPLSPASSAIAHATPVDMMAKPAHKKKVPRHLKTKHRKINREHPEFELTYDMMLGIRTTVSMVEAKRHQRLKSSDFTTSLNLRFPGGGSNYTPAHVARDFKFKDYCPEVFRHIRARFDIDPAEYLLCICGNFEFLEFISNSKSGQFFFYSHDRK